VHLVRDGRAVADIVPATAQLRILLDRTGTCRTGDSIRAPIREANPVEQSWNLGQCPTIPGHGKISPVVPQQRASRGHDELGDAPSGEAPHGGLFVDDVIVRPYGLSLDPPLK
jgi:hypothetical protein